MKYINIHRHGKATQQNEWGIENIYKDFDKHPEQIFSAGLHPWFIKKDDWQIELQSLEQTVKSTNCKAIGECGLDRICKTDLSFQKEVFTAQVELANKLNKPLILHCVRAHEDVMQMLAQSNNNVPVVFHGFNKGLPLAEKIIHKGYYLAVGKDLQRPHLQQIFAAINLQHVFLETDDADLSIENMYELAATCHNISTEELSLQLLQNLQKVFNISI